LARGQENVASSDMPGRPEPTTQSLQVDPFRQRQRIIQIDAQVNPLPSRARSYRD